ncbi:hypothetical protein HHL11_25830 [Ramlibacter sp. G-1-2-2]|uniref:HAD family hydrolase n=1 Tax=Ramlibacter agri TaxID=2728837 RepID=A0A848HF84_9BURK|nr:hypothetical protein [Ramlibacter agri]NML47193.1 hypothetical protein [Ramlibacter agri]
MLPLPVLGISPLAHLVLDFNGTLACDGRLLEGVAPRLERLSGDLSIHVVTGDTFGGARAALSIAVIQGEGAAVEALQAAQVVAPDILAALDLLLHPLRLKATLRT